MHFSCSLISDLLTEYTKQRSVAQRSNVVGSVDGSGRYESPPFHNCLAPFTIRLCAQIWFDFDHVDLSPGRRDYLEYRFGTVRCWSSVLCCRGIANLQHIFKVKSYNGRNHFFIPFIVRIPYYIWVGCSRKRDTSRFVHAFEIEGGNLLGNCSPVHRPTVPVPMASLPDLDLGPAALGDLQNANLKEKSAVIVNVTPPLRYIQGMPSSNSSGSSQSPAHSSFHYQLKHVGYQSCSTQHI